MGKSFEKGVISNFRSVNKARKVKVRGKNQRIKSGEGWGRTKGLNFCKKWLTHDHKSENHTVVACRGTARVLLLVPAHPGRLAATGELRRTTSSREARRPRPLPGARAGIRGQGHQRRRKLSPAADGDAGLSSRCWPTMVLR